MQLILSHRVLRGQAGQVRLSFTLAKLQGHPSPGSALTHFSLFSTLAELALAFLLFCAELP